MDQAPTAYDQLADLWPLASPLEESRPQAALLAQTLRELLPTNEPRPRVLELASGAGHLTYYLSKEFDVTALDLSEAMLERSRRINPTVEHALADMRRFDLGQRFDAVIAPDGVDYLDQRADVAQMLAAAYAHLAPGGLLLLCPVYTSDTFVDQERSVDVHEDAGRELAVVSHVRQDSAESYQFTLLLMLRERGRLTTRRLRQRCGLWSVTQWRTMMAEAGFELLEPIIDEVGPSLPARRPT